MLNSEGELTDLRTVVIVAANPNAAERSAGEIAALGRHGCVRRGWTDAPTAIVDTIRLAAVFVDADGVGDDTIADRLPAIIAASDAPLVVSFDLSQLDQIIALVPADTVLLCDATPAQRIGGMAQALQQRGWSVRDTSRDARRFQLINEEVARFAEMLARLSEAEPPEPPSADPFIADPGSGFNSQPIDVDPAAIRRVIRGRRLREDAFNIPGLFEDPAWDMLLDLFAAELERRRVSVSSLCIASAVPPTTALRWIGRLVDAGLLERKPDDFDRRRAFISLTARASTAMRNYVAAMRRAGLHFG